MAHSDSLPPIPTPTAQRWREFRIQFLPVIVFFCILASIALMWRSFVTPSGPAVEVEAVKSNAISLHHGMVAEFPVDGLQVIGEIAGADPDR